MNLAAGGCAHKTARFTDIRERRKAENAAAAGASAAVIINASDPQPPNIGGESDVAIPVVGIGRDAGNAVKEKLSMGVVFALYRIPTRLIGADEENQVLLYTLDPIEPGSSQILRSSP